MAKNQKPVLRKGAVINIAGRRWFDRVNGNTYHSVYVYVCNGGKDFNFEVGFRYGYDDAYKYTAMEKVWKTFQPCKALREAGKLDRIPFWQLKDFYKIVTNVTDVQRKKDL